MRAGYHSYCGCCGNPCSEQSDWCDRCLPHVADTKGPPWERTYFAQTGKPCMYEDYDGCGAPGIHGYCERPLNHDGPHSATFWWPRRTEDGPLAELIEASEARMSDDTNTTPEEG